MLGGATLDCREEGSVAAFRQGHSNIDANPGVWDGLCGGGRKCWCQAEGQVVWTDLTTCRDVTFLLKLNFGAFGKNPCRFEDTLKRGLNVVTDEMAHESLGDASTVKDV